MKLQCIGVSKCIGIGTQEFNTSIGIGTQELHEAASQELHEAASQELDTS